MPRSELTAQCDETGLFGVVAVKKCVERLNHPSPRLSPDKTTEPMIVAVKVSFWPRTRRTQKIDPVLFIDPYFAIPDPFWASGLNLVDWRRFRNPVPAIPRQRARKVFATSSA